MQPGKIQIGNKIITGQTVFQEDENGNYVGTVVIITNINNTQELGGVLLFSLVLFINNNYCQLACRSKQWWLI